MAKPIKVGVAIQRQTDLWEQTWCWFFCLTSHPSNDPPGSGGDSFRWASSPGVERCQIWSSCCKVCHWVEVIWHVYLQFAYTTHHNATLYSTTLHSIYHIVALNCCIALPCTALHCIAWRYNALHYIIALLYASGCTNPAQHIVSRCFFRKIWKYTYIYIHIYTHIFIYI